MISRRHLCPLDGADHLPNLKFGPNRVRKYDASELSDLIGSARWKDYYPGWTFDADSFSEFYWLVVEEAASTNSQPPDEVWLDFSKDYGEIDPHREPFPKAVTEALFALLLMPWEDWVSHSHIQWRPFTIPWVHTSDLAADHPGPCRSPNNLWWEDVAFEDERGEEIVLSRPARSHLSRSAADKLIHLHDVRWSDLTAAGQSELFRTPVAHFMTRAFLSEGIDEFLAHMTMIEAALGLHDGRKKGGATARVAGRISSLLNKKAEGDRYKKLFDRRSEYVHGREMSAISSEDRLNARQLAQRVANALVDATLVQSPPNSRETFLRELLSKTLSIC